MQAPTPESLLERIQIAAERGRADDGLPPREVHAYRAVYRAVRAAPVPRPPAGFARSLAALVADQAERAAFEVWLLRGLLLALALGSAFALGLLSADHAAQATVLLQRFGANLAAVLAALLAALLVDALLARRQGDGPTPRQG